jgi:hypothetical protein
MFRLAGAAMLLACARETAAGTIVAWGYNGYGAVSRAPMGTGFTAVAGSYVGGVALTPEPCSLLVWCGLGVWRKRKAA